MASLGSILAMNTRQSHDYGQSGVYLGDEYEADAVEGGYEQGFKRDTDEVAGEQIVYGLYGPARFFFIFVRDNGGQGIGYQAVLHQQEECYEHH